MFFRWIEVIDYLWLIDHEDQDMIEMDIHVENPLVIRFDLIDLPYFLECEVTGIQLDLIEYFLQDLLLNDVF
jgi:hypothetical protein